MEFKKSSQSIKKRKERKMKIKVDLVVCYRDNTWSHETIKWSDGRKMDCTGREKWQVEQARCFLTESDIKGVAKDKWFEEVFKTKTKEEKAKFCHLSIANVEMTQERINENLMKTTLSD